MLIFYDKEKKLLLNFMNNFKRYKFEKLEIWNMEFYSFSLSFWRKKNPVNFNLIIPFSF